MTLLLTCVTPQFAVQASDRRLTHLDGSVAEEIANKATMLCRFATFAYTGLARCSVTEPTDELLLRCLAAPTVPINGLLDGLAKRAARAIRGLPLRVAPEQRRAVRRTSFVGAGFLGIRNPDRFGRPPSPDELHPFLAVVSNAQDLTEQWRAAADQEFTVHVGFLGEDQPFQLHAAGQPFTGPDRVGLERDLRRCLVRVEHPEPIARLLTRSIRQMADSNQRVGHNVMCTMVRRDQVGTATGSFAGGVLPLRPDVQAEVDIFRRLRGGEPTQWIFSPAGPKDGIHYGPNYACDGIQLKGIQFGVATATAQG
jgi:hypothetical protein